MSDKQSNSIETPDSRGALDEQTLQRYLDGRLSSEEQHSVSEGLKRSPEARRKLDALREEERLLRGALERLSEPPVKIAEKVMTQLYAEHNRHMTIIRTRRFRNRLVAALSVAALLLIAVMSLQPRESAGRFLAGPGVTRLRDGAERKQLTKQDRFYPGDRLLTAKGQFARLMLADGSVLDLGEHSELKIEQFGTEKWLLLLTSGTVRVRVAKETAQAAVEVFGDEIRVDARSDAEISVARRLDTVWPDIADPWQNDVSSVSRAGSGERRARLSVFKGSAQIVGGEMDRSTRVSAEQTLLFAPHVTTIEDTRIQRVLPREDEEWFQVTGNGPKDRAMLGLLGAFEWRSLGSRMGLLADLPGGQDALKEISSAFATLELASATIEPEARAQRLGKGLQSLRSASEVLVLSDPRRWRGRTLEGLVHFDRARVLLGFESEEARGKAKDAFLAALVAFEEALTGGETVEAPKGTPKAPGLAKLPAPAISLNTRVNDLAPDEHAFLLAAFYKPWAQYHLSCLMGKNESESTAEATGKDAAKSFSAVHDLMGRSVEVLVCRYGWALSMRLTGNMEEAEAKLRDLASTSLAGLSKKARACTEGLRQASLVNLATIFAATNEDAKLREILDTFRIRYPSPNDSRVEAVLKPLEAASR